jgi:hypothetical protein
MVLEAGKFKFKRPHLGMAFLPPHNVVESTPRGREYEKGAELNHPLPG